MRAFKLTTMILIAVLFGFTAQVKAETSFTPDPGKEYVIKRISDENVLTYNGTNVNVSFTASSDLFAQTWRLLQIGENDYYYIVSTKIDTDGLDIASQVEHINDRGKVLVENSPGWHAVRFLYDDDNNFAIINVNGERGSADASFDFSNNKDSGITVGNCLFKIEEPAAPASEEIESVLSANLTGAQAVVSEITAQQNAGITVFGEGGRYQEQSIYTTLQDKLTDATTSANLTTYHTVWVSNLRLSGALYNLFASPVITAGDYYLRNANDIANVFYRIGNNKDSYLRGGTAYNYNNKDNEVYTFIQSVENGAVAVQYKDLAEIEAGTIRYWSSNGNATTTPGENDSVVFHYDISTGKYAAQFAGKGFIYGNGSNIETRQSGRNTFLDTDFIFSILPENIADALFPLLTAVNTAITKGIDENSELILSAKEILKYKYNVPEETIRAIHNEVLWTTYPVYKNVATSAEKWIGLVAGSGSKQELPDNLGHFYGGTNSGSVFSIGYYDFSQGLDTVIVEYATQTTTGTIDIYFDDYTVAENKIASMTPVNTGWTTKSELRTTILANLPTEGIRPVYIKLEGAQANMCALKLSVTPPLIITENTTISESVKYPSVTIEQGAQLTVAQGATLITDTLTLKSNTANYVAGGMTTYSETEENNDMATFINNGTATIGIANVVQYLYTTSINRTWYYLSSPLSDATSALFGENNKIGDYNETTETYSSPFAESTVLIPGKGYAVLFGSNDSTYVFTGSLNDGTVSIPLTRTSSESDKSGFNLVGNPYPSYLDWNKVSKTNVETTIWTRTFENEEMIFKTYNSASNESADGNTTAHIAPLQGFWVRVAEEKANGTDLTLEFTNDSRLHKEEGDANLRTLRAETRPLLRLQVSNGTNYDYAVILFDDLAENGFDSYDSEKMSNNNAAVPEIYTLAGDEKAAINTLTGAAADRELPLGFKTGLAGTFSLAIITQQNLENVTLIDKTLGKEIDLVAGAYEFTSDATDNTERFAVAFRAPAIVTALSNVQTGKWMAWAVNGEIVIKQANEILKSRNLEIYNAVGIRVFNRALPAGVYFVKANGETKKVIVK
ncbi:MAG: hypothetical protein LBG15_01760 [Dysgonamonadaceae bacterium]|nr:hypothetical protein [Dysgonamonadaceae bacterium]